MSVTREEFLAERATGIGGSDAHHIHSLPPYGCARRLWYEKRGIPPDAPREMNSVMRRGVRLEDIAAEYYEEVTGRDLINVTKAQRHKKYPQILVHIDRRITAQEKQRGPGVFEAKTVGEYMWRKIKEDGVPDYMLLQVQHAMLATNLKWGALGLYQPDSDGLIHFDVERNEKFLEAHLDACLKFWAAVQQDEPPPRLQMHLDEHERCKTCPWTNTCQGEGMAELLSSAPPTPEHEPRLLPLIAEYRKIKPLVDEAEKELKRVEAEMKTLIGDRVSVSVPMLVPGEKKSVRVDFKPRMEWDIKKLEHDKPELAQQFTRLEWKLGELSEKRPDLAKGYKRAGTMRPMIVYYWKGKEEK